MLAARAITATDAWTTAIAANVRAIPRGRKRERTAPIAPVANTPRYSLRKPQTPSGALRPLVSALLATGLKAPGKRRYAWVATASES